MRQEELAHAHSTELKETERAQQNALVAAVRIIQVRSQDEKFKIVVQIFDCVCVAPLPTGAISSPSI